ncbi:MAG: agmatine deiminase family protein [Bdellovibrionales bacterium]|nr:agmatine deiminase family protein [Bdellovibrionales bacterium]
MRVLLTSLILLTAQSLWAQQLPVHGPSDEQIEMMAQHNSQAARSSQPGPVGYRADNVQPFFEYGKTGYIVMSDDDYYGVAKAMKQIVASNLPSDVQLIVYTQSGDKNYQKSLVQKYSQFIPQERLHVLQVPVSGSNDFWSRDNLPMPIWEDGKFALSNARYYYNFEPDAYFKQLFGVNMFSHNYFYEGGNFGVNSRGDCLLVNRKKSYPGGVSDTAAIPDDIFKNMYGCKTVTRFKHLKGIGHTDEVIKFLTDDDVITDEESYVAKLEQMGFKVHLVPEPDLNYETYINSIIVDDTAFVPVFGEKNDQKVIDLYKSFGYKVVTVPSRQLATQGQGGIHCITMNYPPMPFANLVRGMNATVIH